MKCGKPCEAVSRVVGYFSETTGWNPGKKEEWKDRIPYKIPTREEIEMRKGE